MTRNLKNGGLNMVNITTFIKSLKVTWIRRIIKSNSNTPWVKLFEHTVTKLTNIIYFGVLFLVEQLINIDNPFWEDTIIAWKELCLINVSTYPHDYLTSPLWYNPFICKQPIFIKSLYDKEIKTVGDIINNNSNCLS